MKLLYDGQIFALQQSGGISRYFYELMCCSAASGVPEFELVCPYASNAYLWGALFLQLKALFTRRCYKLAGTIYLYER